MNGTMFQFFEWYYPADGSLWEKVKAEAKKLAGYGITAIWLPPAFKGSKGATSEGYDVYDIYDLGEFNQKGTVRTKYGTKQQYINAVKTAHDNSLQVYADIVLNHMNGADETEHIKVKKVNPENRNEYISDVMEIEAHTKFVFPGRQNRYSAFKWDYRCFSGVDHADNVNEEGIFTILNDYEGWEEFVSGQNGNYDFLMFCDIEFRNAAVREELKRWIKWYYDTIPFDGLRLDAVKHMPVYFYNEWLDYVRNEIREDMFAVGECWSADVSMLLKYIEASAGRMSLFDSPLQANFHQASESGNNYNLCEIFKNTLIAHHPDLAVTFVSNHDTQPGQSLESAVAAWFKPLAYALILLREQGYPCIFYADMYGADYTDKDHNENTCHVVIEKLPVLEQLLLLRKNQAYGLQRDYFDHFNCIGWVREGTDEQQYSGCAVIMSNGAESIKKMKIGKRHANKIFIDALGNINENVVIDENGFGDFRCMGGSVSVWIEAQQ
ncbi:alpha-amylase [Parafilimonas sp.]|uniref:alpha-amylase n=1 Tax=Parafilimonas sp. TaxID=1969739 RepID=UPI003F80EED7